jgi:hypothetical protein
LDLHREPLCGASSRGGRPEKSSSVTGIEVSVMLLAQADEIIE